MIFLDKLFFSKKSIYFWHWKLSLKVQFWPFLLNCNSSKDFFFNSVEYVDSWPKSLLFRTHHLWNSTTELILTYICQGHWCSTGIWTRSHNYLSIKFGKSDKQVFFAIKISLFCFLVFEKCQFGLFLFLCLIFVLSSARVIEVQRDFELAHIIIWA